ncbi:class I SAM-dependent methyltransferase [Euzebya tangerina]|uniref:class I SAM-dependent methyltransferase n=1 Tax=Euzebya tangerina TaxID=591198 RepID=UPI000E31014D|nr:class I SAM-dependent methyltransferase [Euzebya tangerina]
MDALLRATVNTYDACAEEYLAAWKDRRPRDSARTFARMAGDGALVLDVAGGPGVDVRLLRDVGLKAASGDLSSECMRVARTFFPKGLLARWDYRSLPFADNQFSGIWAPAALQHLPRRAILPAMREFRRVQATGPIFVTFPEGESDMAPMEDPPAGMVQVTSVTPEELQALLLRLGYVDVEVESRPDPRGIAQRWSYGVGIAPV